MNWEAFLGALLPSILTLLAAIAAYYKAGAAATSASGAHQAADARLEIAQRLEAKLDNVIASLPPTPSPLISAGFRKTP